MPDAQTLEVDGLVLRRTEAERFWHGDVLTQGGTLCRVLFRKARRQAPPDFADRVALVVNLPRSGSLAFAQDTHITGSSAGLARDWAAFTAAQTWAAFLLDNLPYDAPEAPAADEPGAPGTLELSLGVFERLCAGAPPLQVLAKGLYRFALQEGHPMQVWRRALPEAMAAHAQKVLGQALEPGASTDPALDARLLRQLCTQLQHGDALRVDRVAALLA